MEGGVLPCEAPESVDLRDSLPVLSEAMDQLLSVMTATACIAVAAFTLAALSSVWQRRGAAESKDTATMVAVMRAAGTREWDPHVRSRDTLVERLLPAVPRALVGMMPLRWALRLIPGLYGYVLARTRFIDDAVCAALDGDEVSDMPIKYASAAQARHSATHVHTLTHTHAVTRARAHTQACMLSCVKQQMLVLVVVTGTAAGGGVVVVVDFDLLGATSSNDVLHCTVRTLASFVFTLTFSSSTNRFARSRGSYLQRR
jgi:hypothetical protein